MEFKAVQERKQKQQMATNYDSSEHPYPQWGYHINPLELGPSKLYMVLSHRWKWKNPVNFESTKRYTGSINKSRRFRLMNAQIQHRKTRENWKLTKARVEDSNLRYRSQIVSFSVIVRKFSGCSLKTCLPWVLDTLKHNCLFHNHWIDDNLIYHHNHWWYILKYFLILNHCFVITVCV